MTVTSPRHWWRRTTAVADVSDVRHARDAEGAQMRGRTAFLAMVGFTGILLLAPQAYFPLLATFRIAFVAAGISLASYISNRVSSGLPIVVMSRESRFALYLVGWAVVTVPFSLWPGGSVATLQDQYFKSLVIFWLLSNLACSLDRVRQLFWVLALMSVPLAVTGLQNYRAGAFLQDDVAVQRIQGYNAPLTSNPNDLALLLNLILPLAITLFLVEKHVPRRLLLGSVIVLDVTTVIITFSRAGFIALASELAVFAWRLRKERERGWVIAMVALCVMAVPLLPAGYFDRLSTVTDMAKDQTGSSEARWRDIVAATRLVIRHPVVGAGIGNDWLALNEERGPFWLSVHNVYLQYAVDLGLPGLGLFLALLVACIRGLGLVLRRSTALPHLGPLAGAVQISLYAFAVSGLFYPVAYNFYFYYIAGLAVALMNIARRAFYTSVPVRTQAIGATA